MRARPSPGRLGAFLAALLGAFCFGVVSAQAAGAATSYPLAGTISATSTTVLPKTITLVTCKTVSQVIKDEKTRGQKCTIRPITGLVTFTAGRTARAKLARGKHVYATGVLQANGRVVLHLQARLPSGHYTLALTAGHTTMRYSITIH